MKRLLLLFGLICFFATTSFAEEDSLLKAYKREYMFLTTQKEGLLKELNNLKQQLHSIRQKNQEEIKDLQNKLINLKSNITRLEKTIEEINSQLATKEENYQILDATIQQAKETLSSYKINIDNVKSKDKKIDFIFRKAQKLLFKLSKLEKEKGNFFLSDGKKVSGNIIKVGAIARYGISEDGKAGALIPVGDGFFMLWNDDENILGETAKKLYKGQPIQGIGIFLYENKNKPVEPPKPITLGKQIESGGLIGYIIIALGAIALILIIVRLFILIRASINTKTVTEKSIEYIKENKLDEAINYALNRPGIIPKVIAHILKNIGKKEEEIEFLISEAILHYTGKLDTFKNIILVIAAVSPLLGLLGTVSGIIETFYVITEFGTGDPKLMAGGISEALVTTELGLSVAIPTYIIGSILNSWSDRIKELVEEASLKIINVYRQL